MPEPTASQIFMDELVVRLGFSPADVSNKAYGEVQGNPTTLTILGGDPLSLLLAFKIASPHPQTIELPPALEAMRKDWPQSAKWPIAFGGFSGGSKRSGALGTMLAKTGSVRICGFFLSGINEDRLSESYRTYQPGRGFLEVPVWLSSGDGDTVATPQSHTLVKASLERTGFRHVRLEQFSGSHQLKMSEVRRALQWFRQLGKF